MDIQVLVGCMGSLFLMIAVGFICTKAGLIDHKGVKGISSLVVNVALSAKIIESIITTDTAKLSGSAGQIVLAIAAAYFLWWVIGFLFSRFMPKEKAGIFLFMVLFGNIGFLGFPLISVLHGEENLFYVAFFNLPFNILVYTYGIYLIRGSSGGPFKPKSILNVPVISVVTALFLLALQVKLPAPVMDTVGYLADMTVPGAMVVVGLSLGLTRDYSLLKNWRLYALSFVILLVRPLVCWLILRLFVTDPVLLSIATLLSAVPVAANTTALCVEYETDETLASTSVLVTTALSIFTIPLIGVLLL